MNPINFKEVNPGKYNIPEIGIGMLGYGFMGKAHSNAYHKMSYMSWPPVALPKLTAICGRTEAKVEEAAVRYKYTGYYTDWRDMAKDPAVDLFDNGSSDRMHYEPTVAAAKEGKHVFCEKPLAVSIEEAEKMLETAAKAGVKHMCGFNYRFIPAVRLAKNIIDEGKLGNIYQFTGHYFHPFGSDPGEVIENIWYAGPGHPGVLYGIGSHLIDVARFLVGEIDTVMGITKNFNPTRFDAAGKEHTISGDECNAAIFEFSNGALGSLETSCIAPGRMNHQFWEVNGSKGSIYFDLEDLNHLHVCLQEGGKRDLSGFTKILVAEPDHPFISIFYPQPGIALGWEDSFVAELHYFIDCIVNNKPVEPYGATFYDGYVNQLIIAAIEKSSASGRKEKIAL